MNIYFRERGSPEHLLENNRCVYQMMVSCKAYKVYSISKLNLYFRELTHGHTGSPEHLLENSG